MARASSSHIRPRLGASGLSTLIKDHLADGASRLASLLLPQILPVFSVVAPCQTGAALRDLALLQRGQATSANSTAAARRQSPVRACFPAPADRNRSSGSCI